MDRKLKIVIVAVAIAIVVAATVLVYVNQKVQPRGPVANVDTGLSYDTIQKAINAPETVNGHTLVLSPHVYNESVEVNKTLTIRGRIRETAIVEKGAHPEVFWIRANGTTVANLTVRNCEFGIWCRHVTDCSVIGNRVMNISASAIKIETSTDCIVADNEITNGTLRGIELANSFNITVRNNRIRNVRISSMTIPYGAINLESSHNNTITLNEITSNAYGIFLYISLHNRIVENNFIANTHQTYTTLSTNVWDGGYLSGGNYWSDYGGVDLYSGPDQNILGGDGKGDTPYTIQASEQDRYPLIQPASGAGPT